MKLYITAGSPYARIARIVIIEKGLEDRIDIVPAQTRLADSPYFRITESTPRGGFPIWCAMMASDWRNLRSSAVSSITSTASRISISRRGTWSGRRAGSAPWQPACWMACQYGAEKSYDLKTSNRP